MSSVDHQQPDSQRLGDFEIVREIGRGGMGIVYEARQVSLNRKVALKVLSGTLSAKAVERFQREAEAAAKLHHTNIVPIYATGCADQTHYYAMELIEGPSLDRVIRQLREDRQQIPVGAENLATASLPVANTLPAGLLATGPHLASSGAAAPAGVYSSELNTCAAYFDTAARMIADVADALEHAHRNGVIHRDIKPSNLLLSPDGRLSLNDFGLARMLEMPGMTMTGEFVGTPAYMSPEQITGGHVPVDGRTDIYSLGATLYEMLTLGPLFIAERRDQLLNLIVQKEPRRPRQVNRKAPVDLETICLKALEKDPNRRYQTAAQLADDLRRFVNRYAIQARRPGALARLRKWVRRHPALTGALACVLVAALAVVYFAYRAHVSEEQYQAARRLAEEKARVEQRQAALVRTTEAAMRGKFTDAERAIDEAIALGASAGEIRLLRGLIDLHRGNMTKAIEHLEAATRLLPESVAARAILLRAYHDAGQFDQFYSKLQEAGELTPRTAEDYLYYGQVMSYVDPREGLPLLDRAIELRDGALPRLVRAEVRTGYAQMTGLVEDVRHALDDVLVARTLLPDDPLALTASLEAHLLAACSYERHRQLDKSREMLQKAGRDAEALKSFSSLRTAVRQRLLYLDYIGDDDAVHQEYLREKAVNGGAVSARFYFNKLYRKGEFVEALDVLEQMPRAGNEVMYHMRRGFVLPHLPDGRQRTLAAYAEGSKIGGSPSNTRGYYIVMVLEFLGREQKEKATEIYRKIAKEAREGVQLGGQRAGWRHSGYDYRAGRITAEQLLRAAGPSLWWQCEGQFVIGLNLLSEGDRAGARRHFEACVATRVLSFLEYDWSRSFLARMDADPAWPPWLPVKK